MASSIVVEDPTLEPLRNQPISPHFSRVLGKAVAQDELHKSRARVGHLGTSKYNVYLHDLRVVAPCAIYVGVKVC